MNKKLPFNKYFIVEMKEYIANLFKVVWNKQISECVFIHNKILVPSSYVLLLRSKILAGVEGFFTWLQGRTLSRGWRMMATEYLWSGQLFLTSRSAWPSC